MSLFVLFAHFPAPRTLLSLIMMAVLAEDGLFHFDVSLHLNLNSENIAHFLWEYGFSYQINVA